MRTIIFAAVVLISGSAYGQAAPAATPPCFPSSHIDKVVVEMADGTTKRGSLLCLGAESITLAEPRAISSFQLDEIRRIRKAADPVWDGAAKGASIGVVMLVLCGGHCSSEAVLRTTLAYGAFGLLLDSIDTNTDAIYRPGAGKRVAAGFRVRF